MILPLRRRKVTTHKPMIIQHTSLFREEFLSTQKLSDADADRIASALLKK